MIKRIMMTGLVVALSGFPAFSQSQPAETPPSVGASTPTPAIPEALRQAIQEGTKVCLASLASAPKELTLGEVNPFCECMGVQEAAMGAGGMDDTGRRELRPRLQSMCVSIIRGRQTREAQPAPPSPPATQEQETPPEQAQPAPANAPQNAAQFTPFVAKKGRLPFEGNWRLRESTTCAGGYSISRNEIIERTADKERRYRVSGVKRQNEMVYLLTIVGNEDTNNASKAIQMRVEIENGSAVNLPKSPFGENLIELVRCPYLSDSGQNKTQEATIRPEQKLETKRPERLTETQCKIEFTRLDRHFRPRLDNLMGEFGRTNSVQGKCNVLGRTTVLMRQFANDVSKCSHFPAGRNILVAARKQVAENSKIMRDAGCR